MIQGREEFIRAREKDTFWKAPTPSLLPRVNCPSEILNHEDRISYPTLLALAAYTQSDHRTNPGHQGKITPNIVTMSR